MKRFCKRVIFSFLRQNVGMKGMTKSKFSKSYQTVSLTVTLKVNLVSKAKKPKNFNTATKMKVTSKIIVKMMLVMISMMITTVSNQLIILKRVKLNLRKGVVVKQKNK